MASAQESNVSQESQDGPILQLREDSNIARFVFETAQILLENGRFQDFPYLADRSADVLHGNKILKQILSEITSKCDEKTAYEEMQKYMYRLVLEELLQKSSVGILAILALVLLQESLLATMEYLVPYSNAIKHELQPEKIANELKSKLDEYTRYETDGEAYLRSSDYSKGIQCYEKALAISAELGYQLGIVKGHYNLASVYLCMAQYEKAVVNFNECLTVIVKTGYQSAIAASNRNLGLAYFKLKRYEESIDYFKKNLDMYTKMENQERIAASNQDLGLAYFMLEKYEESIDYFEKSLDMYTKMENQERIAASNQALGLAYFKLKKCEESLAYFKKSLDMYTKLGKWGGVARSSEYLGRLYGESLGQYKKCINYFKKSLDMYTKLGKWEQIARSNTNLGDAYYNLEKNENVIDYYKKSLHMYTKLENQEEMANSNKYLGIVYYKLKKFEESIYYCKNSLDMYTKLGNSKGIASSNRSLGEGYLSVRRYEEASRHFKDSLAMYTEMGDQSGIANTNGDLGDVFLAVNQPEKAMECFKKLIAINTKMENQSAIARGNAILGFVYRSVGEYEKCITHSEIALRISGSVNDKLGQATCYSNLGDAYNELRRYEKAIFYNQKALEISTEIGNRLEMARINANLGATYLNSEKFEKAMEYFEKSLAITTDIGNQDDIARIIGNMGSVYLGMGQLEKAIDCCKRSLALSDEIGDQSIIAANNVCLGNIYVNWFMFEEAVSYYEKSIEISSLIRDQKIESHCLGGIGRCYYLIYLRQPRSGLEPLKRSISYFRKSIECYESIFLNLIVDENQTSFTNQYVSWYVFLKSCYIFLERFETALLVADLGKAKTLQISIEKRSNVADYARKTWQAIDEEKEEDQINDIVKAVQLEKNCATVLYYSFDCMNILNVWVLNCSHGNVNISIPTYTLSSKDYIHTNISKLLNTFHLTIDRRSSFFHSRRDVLEIDVEKLLLQESNPRNRVFRNEASARSEVKKQDLKKVAQRYDLAVEIEKKKSESKILESLNVDKANMNEGGTDSSEHLRNLFMALIRPIQDFIKGTKLVIIPDDFLFFVPFSALLDENGFYLSEKYSIQITPSLHTLYSRMLVSESVSLGPALFVGNPTVGSVSFEGEILAIPSLPSATEEVTLLASHFDARPLTGCEAIKSRVLNRISDSSIIHIAAHGDKLRGKIYLSPNPEWIEQGFDLPNEKFYLLQERDIISMDIKARLVVLSCCTTGRGKISSEGVIGLARSFLAAGAQSVLATLWRIHDEGTKLFMEKFYDELLKEVSVCEALKTTMNVFQRHETGFYRLFSIWAPFTIFGKDVRFSREDIEEIKRRSREISF